MADRIGIASDHAGFELKEFVRVLLDKRGIPTIDYGTYTTESVNYADFGHKLAAAIERGEVAKGIAICGSGNGINMTLNRHAAEAEGKYPQRLSLPKRDEPSARMAADSK